MKKIDVNPNAKALIFDLDGTIADTMPVHFMAYKNILNDYGIVFTPELFVTMAGIPAIETIKKLNRIFGTDMDPKKTGVHKEKEYEKIMHKMRPVEPVVELIKNYHGKLPMSIGTGSYKRVAWKTLQLLELDKYFDILVSAEDVSQPKPDPETFIKCAQKMGVEPSSCQVLEDGEPGVKAAVAAGMMYTMVTDYYDVTIGEEI